MTIRRRKQPLEMSIYEQVDSSARSSDQAEDPPPRIISAMSPPKATELRLCASNTPISWFDSLPPEIISLIANELDGRTSTLKALRGVNKTCESACTRLLFHHLTLGLDTRSMAHLHCILGNPAIRHVVIHLSINTAEYTDKNMDTFDWDDRDEELLKLFNHYLTRVGRFHNLKSAHLTFSKSCVGPPLRRHWWASQVPESVGFRTELLQSLFRGLNDTKNPMPKFHSLTIENLQDWDEDALVKSIDFTTIMAKIRCLELQVATEHDEGSPTKFLEKKELHEFFNNQLRRDWISPCAQNLTQLKLYAGTVYWGYIPKCVLPHLPNLKSLSLGKMTFTHDSQLSWILSHAATLEELVLDDCPIIIGAAWYGTLDADGYPLDTTAVITADSISTLTYTSRWHHYFRSFRRELRNLRSLRCGFDSDAWEMATAFTDSHTLQPRLWPERYRVFDSCWLERPPFATINAEGEVERGEYDGTWSQAPFYPDCTDEDLTELVKLREIMAVRTGVIDEDLATLQKILF